MDDDDKPRLTVASERSAAEIEVGRAVNRTRYPLAKLTANILRILAGAGEPDHVYQQLKDALAALDDYHEIARKHGRYGEPIISAFALRPDTNDESPLNRAEQHIRRGALRYTAGELLGQQSQASAGQNAMHEGIREFREALKK